MAIQGKMGREFLQLLNNHVDIEESVLPLKKNLQFEFIWEVLENYFLHPHLLLNSTVENLRIKTNEIKSKPGKMKGDWIFDILLPRMSTLLFWEKINEKKDFAWLH